MAQLQYETEIRHEGLHKYEVVRGRSPYEVQQKAQAKLAQWDQMWQKHSEKDSAAQDREEAKQRKEEQKALAAQRTEEARQAITSIEDTLKTALKRKKQDYWANLLEKSEFAEPPPARPGRLQAPAKPLQAEPKYNPAPTFLDRIFPSRLQLKRAKATLQFKHDLEQWQKQMKELKEKAIAIAREYTSDMEDWKRRKDEYLVSRKWNNASVNMRKQEYLKGSPEAIEDYCRMVLSDSEYPETFPKHFELNYNHDNKILLVDYSLPNMTALPTLKEVKYVQTRDEITEIKLADSAREKLYDGLLYQIVLRSVYELYQADQTELLEGVVFNGWVNSVDPSTGQKVNACVLSLQANRAEFLAINLAKVKPKECFRKLKGVGSSKLHSLSAVAPIMKLDRSDKRFVSSHDVADSLDDTYNLAAMDWEDFEHLIRELFEQEFTQGGGEVKVTRASRDGGVDAIAFDPDPIRGGKIVIQAKRYTNVVGVSAVRDLYGTVVNEGATKGILVTTAAYGPDAYGFAKGKPLTLLDGSNLLHLLEKHGQKAKIDLKEAKQLMAERDRERRRKI